MSSSWTAQGAPLTATEMAGRESGTVPFTREQGRLEMLRQAGVTEQLVPLLRKAVATLTKDLHATTTQYFSYQGTVHEHRIHPDNVARAKAREQVFELCDVLRSRTEAGGSAAPVIVNVVWPEWAAPSVVDVEVPPDDAA